MAELLAQDALRGLDEAVVLALRKPFNLAAQGLFINRNAGKWRVFPGLSATRDRLGLAAY